MRIHHWFRTIAGALALTAAAESGHAQEYGVPGPGMAPPPGYGPANPGTMYPQGVPQGFDPWPQISPFGNGNLDQDQYRNSGGLWFQDLIYKHRDFYFGVDAVYGFTKGEGNTQIGAPTMSQSDVTNGLTGYMPDPIAGPVGGNTGGTSTEHPSQVFLDPRVYPYPFYYVDGGDVFSTPRNDLFPVRKDNILGNVNAAGLQVRWGFDDADGVGMMFNGFYMAPNSQLFQVGQDSINGIPITPEIVNLTQGKFLNPLGGSLPVYTGLPLTVTSTDPLISGTFGSMGASQKFDILFSVERKIESAGAGMAFYMNPLYKTSATMLRPYVGGHYMYVKESFGFRGIDSGYMYEIDGVTQGAGGTNTVPSFRPDWDTAIPLYDQFEARLNSTVQTHLAGPEVGLRYDLGRSDGFKVWGATTLGLMANQSNMTLQGNNIGEVPFTSTAYGINMLEEDARFSSKRSHGRVSPLFEQTIAIDSRIFEALPYTNEIPVLNTAIFHFGYTFTAIGQMNRPLDVVNWNGFPLTPTLNNNTQAFVYHRFNFGLEWKY